MTIDLARSQQAIHSFLNPTAADKSSDKKLVIRQMQEGATKVTYIDYDALHSGEKALRFFGTGAANFKNVVEFALENQVLDGLVESDKQALFEKSYTYNQGHNWLRSFMRVNITQLAQRIFGKEKDLKQVIDAIKQKVLVKEQAKAAAMLGPGQGIMQLMDEKNPIAAKILLQQSQPSDPQEKDRLTGKILLHEAIQSGDTELVKGLLANKKIDTFAKNGNGQTALHLAVKQANKEIITLLLVSNPRGINDQDRFGNTALHDAIRLGHKEIVSVLLQSEELDLGVANEQNETPLHRAAFSPLKGLMADLLAHNPSHDVLDKKDKQGQTALGLAMTQNEEAALALLTVASDESRKAVANNVSYEFNPQIYCAFKAREKAPLQEAMLLITTNTKRNARQLDIMQRLIETHNVHQHERDDQGRAPLHRAVETGSLEVIELFLKNKDPLLNLRDTKGRTPLQIAIETGREEIALRLLEDKRVLLNVHDNSGNTPLQAAIRYGNWKIANAILDHEKIGLNHQNQNGSSALMLAISAREPNLEFLKRLLANKDINLSLADTQGQVALHTVMLGDSTGVLGQIFPLLLEATLKQDPNLVNAQTASGGTPLHAAVQVSKQPYIQALLDCPNIDVELKDNYSKLTPLHAAVLKGNTTIVKQLVDSGKFSPETLQSVQAYAEEIGRRNLLPLLKF